MLTHFIHNREDQADEYRDLKKDLEQTAKNCRILQFKLRKAERRIVQLETEKNDLETKNKNLCSICSLKIDKDISVGIERTSQLESELNQTRGQLIQAQLEVEKLQTQIRQNCKELSSSGPVLSKSRSLEVFKRHNFYFYLV